jgi:hypothetical protein
MGKGTCCKQKKTGALVFYTQEIGLKANTDKTTKYMAISPDQNAGLSHSIKVDNTSFETVEQFKHLATTVQNQNYIREEITSRLKSGNACYR